MKKYNCIVIINTTDNKILFCKRMKEPYKNKYNFVGGKVELGETSLEAAYRELREETAITDIELFHLMDFTYYVQEYILEIYVGEIKKDVSLEEEKNPLLWISIDEDFTDPMKYAGDQNIAHIINMALKFLRK